MHSIPISIALLGAVLASVRPSPSLADSPSHAVHPARHDLCAKVDPTFGGAITYDHGKYHWACSGQTVLDPASSSGPFTFNVNCGASKMDPRKRYGIWLSSSSVQISQVIVKVSRNQFAVVVRNESSRKQKGDVWVSCLGPGM